MTIQKFFTSRDNGVDSDQFVGQEQRLWYDPVTNAIYVSDGNTPGGILVSGGGFSGYSGYSGFSGYSGAPGATGTTNLIWATSGNYRTLVEYVDPGNVVQTIRTAQFANNLLQLTLASFTPTLSATASPSGSLNWDVPATGFGVNVVNPNDYTDQWISNVASLTVNSGSISALNTFTAGAQSNVPGPTVDWSQSFTTNGSSYIRPVSSTITGGSANANVDFNYWNGSSETLYSGSTSFNVSWATPTISLSLAALSGATFLEEYASTSYTLSVTGMASSSNYSNAITASGGTVSNPTGSGTFTFTTPINKDNTASTRTVSDTTTFTRPSTVTGSSYSTTLSSTTSNPSASFTYPSLWVFTVSTFDVPVNSTYVTGNSFQSNVTVLSNQTHVVFGYINNTDVVPLGFWFAVRSAATQPTSFKTGASPSLLNDVAYVTGSVSLSPTSPPGGYTAEPYNLYGITLQPGSTYVSIS